MCSMRIPSPEQRYSVITTGAPKSIVPIHEQCSLVLPFGQVENSMESEDPPTELEKPIGGPSSIDPAVSDV